MLVRKIIKNAKYATVQEAPEILAWVHFSHSFSFILGK